MSGWRLTDRGRDGGSYAVAALIFTLALLACISLIPPVLMIGMWVEGPNEGWNATHSLHAFSRALYPSPSAFLINNYPPLWFYLNGGLAQIFGDPIFLGRIISFSAFAATAAGILGTVRRLGGSAGAGALAALSFVATIAVLYRWWIGVAEPQMLAHALITGGTALVVGAQTRRMAIVAALIMMLGGLTKHIAVALPLATVVWLAIYRRQLLYPWLATALVTGLIALLGLVIGYGQVFIDNIAFPRTFSLRHLGSNLGWGITKAIVPLIAFSVLALAVRRARDEAMVFAGLAIGAALISIVTFGSAWGVNLNVSFDLVIASSIAYGLVWDRAKLITRVPVSIPRLVLVAALVVRLLLGFHSPGPMIAGFRSVSAEMLAMRDVLVRIPDPVACEPLLVCFWGGHHNPSSVGNVRDTEGMLIRLANGEFNAVVTTAGFTGEQDGGHIKGLADAMKRGYRPPIRFGFVGNLFVSKRLTFP